MTNQDSNGELIRLAGLLFSHPISEDSYKLDPSLIGLAAERKRLGERKFLVILNQKVYDIDGLTDYVYLLDSFDSQLDATTYIETSAKALCERQTAGPDKYGDNWCLESEGEIMFMSQPKSPNWAHPIRVICDRTYKLRAGTYDTKYSCFRAIGPFHGEIISDQLFSFINEPFELGSFFVDVGHATMKGVEPPLPQ